MRMSRCAGLRLLGLSVSALLLDRARAARDPPNGNASFIERHDLEASDLGHESGVPDLHEEMLDAKEAEDLVNEDLLTDNDEEDFAKKQSRGPQDDADTEEEAISEEFALEGHGHLQHGEKESGAPDLEFPNLESSASKVVEDASQKQAIKRHQQSDLGSSSSSGAWDNLMPTGHENATQEQSGDGLPGAGGAWPSLSVPALVTQAPTGQENSTQESSQHDPVLPSSGSSSSAAAGDLGEPSPEEQVQLVTDPPEAGIGASTSPPAESASKTAANASQPSPEEGESGDGPPGAGDTFPSTPEGTPLQQGQQNATQESAPKTAVNSTQPSPEEGEPDDGPPGANEAEGKPLQQGPQNATQESSQGGPGLSISAPNASVADAGADGPSPEEGQPDDGPLGAGENSPSTSDPELEGALGKEDGAEEGEPDDGAPGDSSPSPSGPVVEGAPKQPGKQNGTEESSQGGPELPNSASNASTATANASRPSPEEGEPDDGPPGAGDNFPNPSGPVVEGAAAQPGKQNGTEESSQVGPEFPNSAPNVSTATANASRPSPEEQPDDGPPGAGENFTGPSGTAVEGAPKQLGKQDGSEESTQGGPGLPNSVSNASTAVANASRPSPEEGQPDDGPPGAGENFSNTSGPVVVGTPKQLGKQNGTEESSQGGPGLPNSVSNASTDVANASRPSPEEGQPDDGPPGAGDNFTNPSGPVVVGTPKQLGKQNGTEESSQGGAGLPNSVSNASAATTNASQPSPEEGPDDGPPGAGGNFPNPSGPVVEGAATRPEKQSGTEEQPDSSTTGAAAPTPSQPAPGNATSPRGQQNSTDNFKPFEEVPKQRQALDNAVKDLAGVATDAQGLAKDTHNKLGAYREAVQKLYDPLNELNQEATLLRNKFATQWQAAEQDRLNTWKQLDDKLRKQEEESLRPDSWLPTQGSNTTNATSSASLPSPKAKTGDETPGAGEGSTSSSTSATSRPLKGAQQNGTEESSRPDSGTQDQGSSGSSATSNASLSSPETAKPGGKPAGTGEVSGASNATPNDSLPSPEAGEPPGAGEGSASSSASATGKSLKGSQGNGTEESTSTATSNASLPSPETDEPDGAPPGAGEGSTGNSTSTAGRPLTGAQQNGTEESSRPDAGLPTPASTTSPTPGATLGSNTSQPPPGQEQSGSKPQGRGGEGGEGAEGGEGEEGREGEGKEGGGGEGEEGGSSPPNSVAGAPSPSTKPNATEEASTHDPVLPDPESSGPAAAQNAGQPTPEQHQQAQTADGPSAAAGAAAPGPSGPAVGASLPNAQQSAGEEASTHDPVLPDPESGGPAAAQNAGQPAPEQQQQAQTADGPSAAAGAAAPGSSGPVVGASLPSAQQSAGEETSTHDPVLSNPKEEQGQPVGGPAVAGAASPSPSSHPFGGLLPGSHQSAAKEISPHDLAFPNPAAQGAASPSPSSHPFGGLLPPSAEQNAGESSQRDRGLPGSESDASTATANAGRPLPEEGQAGDGPPGVAEALPEPAGPAAEGAPPRPGRRQNATEEASQHDPVLPDPESGASAAAAGAGQPLPEQEQVVNVPSAVVANASQPPQGQKQVVVNTPVAEASAGPSRPAVGTALPKAQQGAAEEASQHDPVLPKPASGASPAAASAGQPLPEQEQVVNVPSAAAAANASQSPQERKQVVNMPVAEASAGFSSPAHGTALPKAQQGAVEEGSQRNSASPTPGPNASKATLDFDGPMSEEEAELLD